jgi:hypothetical protein
VGSGRSHLRRCLSADVLDRVRSKMVTVSAAVRRTCRRDTVSTSCEDNMTVSAAGIEVGRRHGGRIHFVTLAIRFLMCGTPMPVTMS